MLRSYRLYRLDRAGKIEAAEWVDAADDAQAESKARERAGDGTYEVWDRHRLVARISGR